MSTVWLISGWFFAILFGALTVSMLLLKNWPHALVMFLVSLLVFPPVSALVSVRFGWNIPPLLRGVLIAVLLFVFIRLVLGGQVDSIYKSPQVKAGFTAIYDEKMGDWPMPYEDIFVETSYGKIHVIASGLEGAPPLLLLHASGVASWSWRFNAAALGKAYRLYAIDLIGDAGKSELCSLDRILKNGRDQAELYAEISGQLGVEKAYVVGASEGGFIATNYALFFPERVEKLALLGPMGYAGAIQSAIRITCAQLFPFKPIQESIFSWAFTDSPKLLDEFGEWFLLIMNGLNPVKVAPLPFSAAERQSLQVPVMFVFGERDNLVGDPEKAKGLVEDIPVVRVEIVPAGHLMAAENPAQINGLILDFFGQF